MLQPQGRETVLMAAAWQSWLEERRHTVLEGLKSTLGIWSDRDFYVAADGKALTS